MDIYAKEVKAESGADYLHTHVHSSMIHSSQNSSGIHQGMNKQTKCSIGLQQAVIQP